MPSSDLNASEYYLKQNSKYLVVLLHGYGSFKLLNFRFNLRTKLKGIKQVIENNDSGWNDNPECFDCADIYFPDLTEEMSVFSTVNPNAIVRKILDNINKIWRDRKDKYEKIYLIGYSAGALLARKIYICACSQTEFQAIPLEKEFDSFDFELSNQWAVKVDRIILLGGINRGWSIDHHLSLFRSMLWTVLAGIGNVMMLFGKKPFIFSLRKGASFVTQLRIQWIYLERQNALKEPLGKALTVQLLGSRDNLVSPEDNIDSVTGRNFIYLEVPFSDHFSVLEITASKNNQKPNKSKLYQKRKDVFLSALTEDRETLETKSSPLTTGTDIITLPHKYSANDPQKVTDVIFVIHGIRDEGHWTNKIAQEVILQNERANQIRVGNGQKLHYFEIETSRYGYFPMLLFALPWTRRAKLAWFMEQYAENLMLYPNAEFSFIGHSNGTYLLAQALQQYQFCKFKRVVFAGSVVPKEYDWHQYIDREKRVEFVLNYVATLDWVVAIFPNFLHFFQKDLGSAGHDGFEAGFDPNVNLKSQLITADKKIAKSCRVCNIKYVRGQHGAALDEYAWKAIAKFIVEDISDLANLAGLQPAEIFKYSRGIGSEGKLWNNVLESALEVIGKHPWIAWGIIITVLTLIGSLILVELPWGEWEKTVAFTVYLGVIWNVLTKI